MPGRHVCGREYRWKNVKKEGNEMIWMDIRYLGLAVILAAALAGLAGANIGLGDVGFSDTMASVDGLSVAPARGLPGDTISIPVMWGVQMDDIGSADLTFSSGTEDCAPLFTITNIEKGALTQNTLFDWKKTDDDTATFSFASGQGVSGTGSVAVVTVTVKNTAGNDGREGCDYRVAGSIYNSMGADYATLGITEATSVFTLAPAVKGDGDRDGKVTSNDALAALQMAVGKIPEDTKYDMNGDQKVNSNDVREILRLTVVPISVNDMRSFSEGTAGAAVVATATQDYEQAAGRRSTGVVVATKTTTFTGLEPNNL